MGHLVSTVLFHRQGLKKGTLSFFLYLNVFSQTRYHVQDCVGW